jgi:hypothetical protein
MMTDDLSIINDVKGPESAWGILNSIIIQLLLKDERLAKQLYITSTII